MAAKVLSRGTDAVYCHQQNRTAVAMNCNHLTTYYKHCNAYNYYYSCANIRISSDQPQILRSSTILVNLVIVASVTIDCNVMSATASRGERSSFPPINSVARNYTEHDTIAHDIVYGIHRYRHTLRPPSTPSVSIHPRPSTVTSIAPL